MAIAGRGSGPHGSADAERARTGGADLGDRPAEFRYGAVFLIVLTLVVFLVIAPDQDWSRAVALALEATALTVAIATSRVRPAVRRRRAVVGVVVGAGVAVGVLTGPERRDGRRRHDPREHADRHARAHDHAHDRPAAPDRRAYPRGRDRDGQRRGLEREGDGARPVLVGRDDEEHDEREDDQEDRAVAELGRTITGLRRPCGRAPRPRSRAVRSRGRRSPWADARVRAVSRATRTHASAGGADTRPGCPHAPSRCAPYWTPAAGGRDSDLGRRRRRRTRMCRWMAWSGPPVLIRPRREQR